MTRCIPWGALSWILATAVLPAGSAGCRREPGAALPGDHGPAARSGATAPGTDANVPGADATAPGDPAGPDGAAPPPASATPVGTGGASPAAPGGITELVPPIPSGWTPGTQFHAPPPVVVGPVPADATFNMLQNPGFEDGTEPWWYFPDRAHWGGFTVASEHVLSGRWAARLDLLCDEQHPPPDKAFIRGVIQDISTPTFPERISGNYFVQTWERGTPEQYIQFVVIVAGAEMTGAPVQNTQIRYLLAGIDHPPFDIANARFFYVTREEPRVGEWVHFERDVRQDFIDLWGALPERFQHVRVLFETRWDNVDLAAPPRLHSVVWFDDLYLGT